MNNEKTVEYEMPHWCHGISSNWIELLAPVILTNIVVVVVVVLVVVVLVVLVVVVVVLYCSF